MKHNRRCAMLLFCAALILCAAGVAQAQSGRRTKGGTPARAPVSTPADVEQVPATAAIKSEAQRVPLIVTADEHTFASVYAPVNASDTILHGFVDRLEESSAFTIKTEKQMSRSRASDRAKEEKEAYLVWLHFDSDVVSARRHDEPDYFLDYVVFTPGTAKVKTQGKIYLRPYRRNVSVGRVPVGIPVPQTDSRAAWDAVLRQGGSETAERVMAEFDVMR